MAKSERYEPRGDSNRVFDGGELEMEEDEGSRLPLLLVIGLLVVAAFGGVVWLAYTQGVERGRADAPRMLVAADGSTKGAPGSTSSIETPFKGLKIYQQPAPPQEEETDTAPQPPTPKPTPAKKVADTAPPADTDTLGGFQEKPVTPPPVAHPAPQTVAPSPPRALTPPVQQAPKPKPVVAAVKAAPPPPPPSLTSVPGTATAETPSSGAEALQIGSYKSEDEADAAWQAFQRKHPIVGGYQSEIRKVDLGPKGVWYRLRLGSFGDKAAALAFCDKLKADGGSCILAR